MPPEFDLELKVHSVTTKRAELEIFVQKIADKIVRVRLIDFTNDLSKLVRIMAYVIKFCNQCKNIKLKTYVKPTQTIEKLRITELVELPNEQEKIAAVNYFVRVKL